MGLYAVIEFQKNGMIDDFASEPKIIVDGRIAISDGKVVFNWPADNTP